jgi:hypothetical protein
VTCTCFADTQQSAETKQLSNRNRICVWVFWLIAAVYMYKDIIGQELYPLIWGDIGEGIGKLAGLHD